MLNHDTKPDFNQFEIGYVKPLMADTDVRELLNRG